MHQLFYGRYKQFPALIRPYYTPFRYLFLKAVKDFLCGLNAYVSGDKDFLKIIIKGIIYFLSTLEYYIQIIDKVISCTFEPLLEFCKKAGFDRNVSPCSCRILLLMILPFRC